METKHPPNGFKEVSKDEFFALLAKAENDPMPNLDAPDYTTWQTQRGPRVIWGWSAPGWKNPGDKPERYAVRAGD